ncbi:FecR domain-containing protein [Bordetella sp. LUAb4]|uniref:FecR domain-containing protein n=1 Tax=Bordetella sp. LUAb4 TaxID=2843195 RepID=UPI001E56D1A8|nr:FecR domain-containing protein [Bordetella sp. LUAb4]
MNAEETLSARQREATQEAARWFSRLMAVDAQEAAHGAVHDAWRQWFARCPENQWAWRKVEAVRHCFADVPREIAAPTLQRMNAQRRRVLRLALMGTAAVPLGMLLADVPSEWRAWNAQYRTAVGQISRVPIGGGVLAVLDTHSAADVVSSRNEDRIVLRSGRVYVKVADVMATDARAPDARATDAGAQGATATSPRPLIVQTDQGLVYAEAAEFTVGIQGNHSRVRVNQAAVRVVPCAPGAAARFVRAGECADFSDTEVGALQHRPSKVFAAWHTGSMMAVNLPLGDFVRKLRAYRPGLLFVDDALAALPVSGTFPLSRTDLALDALENSYPVRIRRLTQYVTWIEAREA